MYPFLHWATHIKIPTMVLSISPLGNSHHIYTIWLFRLGFPRHQPSLFSHWQPTGWTRNLVSKSIQSPSASLTSVGPSALISEQLRIRQESLNLSLCYDFVSWWMKVHCWCSLKLRHLDVCTSFEFRTIMHEIVVVMKLVLYFVIVCDVPSSYISVNAMFVFWRCTKWLD